METERNQRGPRGTHQTAHLLCGRYLLFPFVPIKAGPPLLDLPFFYHPASCVTMAVVKESINEVHSWRLSDGGQSEFRVLKGGSEVQPAVGHPSLTSLLILVTYSAKHAQLCVKITVEVSVSV